MDTPPNPGSDEAIAMGCKCPVIVNSHGKGFMGQDGVFVYNGSCPIHGFDDDDDDLNEPLGTPACNLGEDCESCQ